MWMILLTLYWNGTQEEARESSASPLVLILEMAPEFDPGGEVWFDVAYLAQPNGETLFREPGERLWWLQNRAILVLGSTGLPLPAEISARATVWVHLIADDGREFGPFELSPRRNGVTLGADIAALADKLGQRLAGIDSSYLAQVAHFLVGNLTALDVVGTSYSISGFGPVVDSAGDWIGGKLAVTTAGSVFVGLDAGQSDDGSFNENAALGFRALTANTAGTDNAAFGWSSLSNNTNADNNTAVGAASLYSNTIGESNTAVGSSALQGNLNGFGNCGIGSGSLFYNISGEENTAVGHLAGEHTTANYNVAVGSGALRQNVSGAYNTALGFESLFDNLSSANTAVGSHSLFANTTGGENTAVGSSSLEFNTTGASNTAVGITALQGNDSGAKNTAVGAQAMKSGSIASFNTAVGYSALKQNLAGQFNTAIGESALINSLADGNTAVGTWSQMDITTGHSNTSIGAAAMQNADPAVKFCTGLGFQTAHSTWADYTTAVGYRSLVSNLSGANNTAVGGLSMETNTLGSNAASLGYRALFANTTGSNNTALGAFSMETNSTGENGTAVGYNALKLANHNNNTACGAFSLSDLTSGVNNTAFGYQAGINAVSGHYNTFVGRAAKATSGGGTISNSMALGDGATVTADNQVRIGDSSVSSIGGQVSWTTLSDGRFKRNVREEVPGLEFIRQLRPVTYELDRGAVRSFLSGSADAHKGPEPSTPESGFIAQEVEAAVRKSGFTFSGVDVPSNDRTPYGLRYGQFVVPLVKAVQEQDEAMNRQAEEIAELKAEIAELKRLLQQR